MMTAKRLLIIEDEDVLRESIKSFLESSNYEVTAASNGVEGIRLAREIIPDLVICDIMMPKMNGYRVLETLRNEKSLAHIPFIFLTARREMPDLRSGMDSGADDYLTKPFRAAELLKAVETRLNRFESARQHGKSSPNESEAAAGKILTENDRLFLKVNDEPQIIRVGDILSIKADGEYSVLSRLSGGEVSVRRPMKEWERLLPENLFLRVHRSAIVNINHIDKIEKWYNRSYVVILKGSQERFIVSQRYLTKVRARFMA